MLDRPLFLAEPSSIEALNSDPQPEPIVEPQPHFGSSNDLDHPIALHEGIRSCATHHPFQNFVSYNHLSPVFHAFF